MRQRLFAALMLVEKSIWDKFIAKMAKFWRTVVLYGSFLLLRHSSCIWAQKLTSNFRKLVCIHFWSWRKWLIFTGALTLVRSPVIIEFDFVMSALVCFNGWSNLLTWRPLIFFIFIHIIFVRAKLDIYLIGVSILILLSVVIQRRWIILVLLLWELLRSATYQFA